MRQQARPCHQAAEWTSSQPDETAHALRPKKPRRNNHRRREPRARVGGVASGGMIAVGGFTDDDSTHYANHL